MPLLACRGLPLGTKCRFYYACVRSVMLYDSETWPVKEEDVIKLKRNDARMATWMYNVRPYKIVLLQRNVGLD